MSLLRIISIRTLTGISKAKEDHIFTFFSLSIHLFRTLLLYQINKLMHDAHISIERYQMLSLLCGDFAETFFRLSTALAYS